MRSCFGYPLSEQRL